MNRKKILMAAANHWQSPIQVGSQHLARCFAGLGWQVGYVSDPISPLHLLSGITPQLRERYSVYAHDGQVDTETSVWNYVPGAALTPHNKPILRTKWVIERWPALTWPNIIDVLAQNGFEEVDLLYCDRFTHGEWLKKINCKKCVYRMSDNNAGFQRYGPAAQYLEGQVAKEADVVFYTASSLEERVKSMAPKAMFHLPNGIDWKHFAGKLWNEPAEYSYIPRPIAVYVGSLDVWFDYQLLNRCVELLPNVAFVLIGPDHLARKKLAPSANLHILGPRPYSLLPAYLQHADVGLIPFDVMNHYTLVSQVNPLKLYEYMACGLPVVSTEWEEIKRLHSPAMLCSSPKEFVSGIRQALSDPPDKDVLKRYAADKDWSLIARKMIEIMGLSEVVGKA